jgi:hypothetical protein
MEAADWPSLSDQELLERRISALGLRLDGTPLEPLIRQLYDELSAKGLTFHPPGHVGMNGSSLSVCLRSLFRFFWYTTGYARSSAR